MQQQQLQDQQAMTQAMHDWDGKDVSVLPELMRKNGISAPGYMNAQQQILARRQQLQTYDTGQLTNLQAHHDAALGVLHGADNLSDADLPGYLQRAIPQLAQQGHLTPQEAQDFGQAAQSLPPDKLRPWMSIHEKGLMGEKEQAAQEIENRKTKASEETAAADTVKATAEKQKADAADWKDFPELGVSLNTRTGEQRSVSGAGGLMTPGMMESKYVQLQQKKNAGQPLDPSDAAWAKGYEKYKTLVPVANFNMNGGNSQYSPVDPQVQKVANGDMKITDVLTPRTPLPVRKQFLSAVLQANPNFDSKNYDIEKGVMKDFTSGPDAQKLQAFNTAITHMGIFQQAADALDNGDVRLLNQVGNSLGTQFGADKATNFNIAKQAFIGEVTRAFDGAGVTMHDREQVEQQVGSASSPAQLKGAAATAEKLLRGKRDVLKQQFDAGKSAQPNFGGQGQGQQPAAAAQTATGPNGHKIIVKDGQWVDAQTGQPLQ